MRKSGILLSACLLAATPAVAGEMTYNGNQASWRSTKCEKPIPPPSLLSAHPETKGNDMNALATQRNAYLDAIQAYMNCISSEAEMDFGIVSHAITAGAQRDIDAAHAEANRTTSAMRPVTANPQK